MEKEAYAQQLMVPEIDDHATQYQNLIHFSDEILPLLESLRTQLPYQYHSFIDQWKKTKIIKKSNRFQDTLEYFLVFLKHSFGMEFHIIEEEDSYQIESINCPLIQLQNQSHETTELQRKTLCYHCSEFHMIKFLRHHNVKYRLTLYPSGCQLQTDNPKETQQNPLFY
ncbi:MAG: hypothetical protein COB02_00695 [Candidatus Cloacimonadota bacterium]|nr:MAG: hypothetical protein COB02_00695 [Candidatus Cloacimonadota bacterium]